jgi:HAE1 family hydrophobic/amphiphilic exporter-1
MQSGSRTKKLNARMVNMMNSAIRNSSLVTIAALAAMFFLCTSAFAQSGQPSPTPIPGPTVSVPAGQPSPTPIPSSTPMRVTVVPPTVLPDEPPPVAPNFTAPIRPLPGPERVGVDIANQLPLTLEEAIQLALKNNNDIDVSRNDVQIAEFNLKGARGVYDPLIDNQTYYESLTTPTASLIGGAVNGAVTLKRLFSSSAISGYAPRFGGFYSARLDSSRTDTSNTNAFLNPQYPTVLNLSFTQPLLRNFAIDNNRRQIEIAKKNLSLSDAQFRQKAIDVIVLVEQAYWNLAFALRNLSVQIDAVKQARLQLESNQRQVDKGALAPIDVVAATAQLSNFEQLVYSAQEDVTRAENSLKTLMLPDRTGQRSGRGRSRLSRRSHLIRQKRASPRPWPTLSNTDRK